MKTIRINRAKWLRGEGIDTDGEFVPNYLWCPDRQAGCCLGHAIHQTAKCAWKDLAGKTVPGMYYNRSSFLTNFSKMCNVPANNCLAEDAMSINDATDISEKKREKRLTEIFAENHIKLEFYN